LRKPELRIRPDRERLSDLGVSLKQRGDDDQCAGRRRAGDEVQGERRGNTTSGCVRSGRGERITEAIARMAVLAATAPGGVARLGSVARLEYAMGPNAIDRFGRQRQVVISATCRART